MVRMLALGCAAVTVAVLASVPVSAPPASSGASSAARPRASPADSRDGTIFFEGDSLTSKYGDVPQSAHQGYWSKLARRLRERSVVDAQGGSGFVKPGSADRSLGLDRRFTATPESTSRSGNARDEDATCDGSTFAERLTPRVEADISRADVVVVEGGRNDFHTCRSSGRLVPVSRSTLRAAVDAYLDRLGALRRGHDPATVYVITPWGDQIDHFGRRRVVPVVRSEARARGFSWIDLDGVLDARRLRANTIDGVHPNAAGSSALATAILHRSDIEDRVHDARHPSPGME